MNNRLLPTINAHKGRLDESMLNEAGDINPIWYLTQEFDRLGNNVIVQMSGINYIRVIFESTGNYVEIQGFNGIRSLHGIKYISDTEIQINAVDNIYNMACIAMHSNGKITKLKHNKEY